MFYMRCWFDGTHGTHIKHISDVQLVAPECSINTRSLHNKVVVYACMPDGLEAFVVVCYFDVKDLSQLILAGNIQCILRYINAAARKLAIIIWNMVIKKQPYNNEHGYEFLDQKCKRKVQEMKKLIYKFDIKTDELGLQLQ